MGWLVDLRRDNLFKAERLVFSAHELFKFLVLAFDLHIDRVEEFLFQQSIFVTHSACAFFFLNDILKEKLEVHQCTE